MAILQRSSIVDVRMGSKYTTIYRDTFSQFRQICDNITEQKVPQKQIANFQANEI